VAQVSAFAPRCCRRISSGPRMLKRSCRCCITKGFRPRTSRRRLRHCSGQTHQGDRQGRLVACSPQGERTTPGGTGVISPGSATSTCGPMGSRSMSGVMTSSNVLWCSLAFPRRVRKHWWPLTTGIENQHRVGMRGSSVLSSAASRRRPNGRSVMAHWGFGTHGTTSIRRHVISGVGSIKQPTC
jgi:hypothetical protein